MRPSRFFLASILCGCAVSTPLASHDILPDGWRLAAEAESSTVTADLNGDGIEDKATLITNGDVTQLLVSLSTKKGLAFETLITTLHEPATCAIKLLPAGKYRTSCGKGYAICAPGEPEVLEVTAPILSFNDENVQVVFIFRDTGVQKLWLSD
jgi:hypothetical protein